MNSFITLAAACLGWAGLIIYIRRPKLVNWWGSLLMAGNVTAMAFMIKYSGHWYAGLFNAALAGLVGWWWWRESRKRAG